MAFPVIVNMPFDHLDHPEEFVTAAAVKEIAQTAEAAGFAGGTVTDHPAPSNKWLEAGGHPAHDPFVILALMAAATEKLRLQTGILVLPYRNPLITARAVATLDVFSGGRVQLGIGAGYMKKEYAALGVDFDSRNDLMDEYMRAMKAAWTGEEFSFSGTGYEANGIRMAPHPVQRPHPPLLVGGNSKRAIRRAVDLGDAWYPFFSPKGVTNTARTVNIADEDDLLTSLAYFHDYCAKSDRAVPPALVCCGLFNIAPGWSAQAAIDGISRYRELGFVSGDVGIISTSRAEWCDQAHKFGEEVLSKLD